jgi:hypothetical protein
MRRPARAIGAETAPELRTVVKTGNEAVEAPQSVVGADPFPWRRHEPAAPEGTGGTRSRTVPPQSGRAVGSLVSGKRELREAGRCLKVLKLRTALAAIKFAARMTNRGERGRSVPPHAISPAVYYAAASLSAAQERRREDPSHAILFWLRLWGSLITARTAQSVSVLPSSVAISIAEVRDAFCRRQHSPVSDCSWVRPTTHRARLTLFRSVFEVNPRYGVCRGGSSPSLAVTGTGALES